MFYFSYLYIAFCVYSAFTLTGRNINKRVKFFHALWIAFMLLCVRGSLQQLGWLLGHLGQAQRMVEACTVILPLKVNWCFLILQLIFGPLTMALCFFVSKGNNIARVWLLRISAILYLNTSFDFFASFARAETEWSNKAFSGLFISLVACGIPYWFVYRFYSNPKVIDSIFSKPTNADSV
jgi:hypothetical protein